MGRRTSHPADGSPSLTSPPNQTQRHQSHEKQHLTIRLRSSVRIGQTGSMGENDQETALATEFRDLGCRDLANIEGSQQLEPLKRPQLSSTAKGSEVTRQLPHDGLKATVRPWCEVGNPYVNDAYRLLTSQSIGSNRVDLAALQRTAPVCGSCPRKKARPCSLASGCWLARNATVRLDNVPADVFTLSHNKHCFRFCSKLMWKYASVRHRPTYRMVDMDMSSTKAGGQYRC